MPLCELFEWYRYHLEVWGIAAETETPVATVDEEIAMMKAAFGGT